MAENALVPQPAQQSGTYTALQGADLASDAQTATIEDLSAAADFITQLLAAINISYALMGGFSL